MPSWPAAPQDRRSKAWLNECLQSANWLMKALDQRARTIVKVASEIVTQQEGFFRHGVSHLKPLTLRAVAEAIGMHESTVSRVTSNKYLACDRGLYELKYFFTSGIQSADGGDAVSAEAVKSRIKALIAAEEPARILSDDQLVDLLKGEGFDIARRTVAKYREAIGHRLVGPAPPPEGDRAGGLGDAGGIKASVAGDRPAPVRLCNARDQAQAGPGGGRPVRADGRLHGRAHGRPPFDDPTLPDEGSQICRPRELDRRVPPSRPLAAAMARSGSSLRPRRRSAGRESRPEAGAGRFPSRQVYALGPVDSSSPKGHSHR